MLVQKDQLPTVEYLAEMALSLAEIAKRADLPTAHLLFDMAGLDLRGEIALLHIEPKPNDGSKQRPSPRGRR
jgi:hypothetical protein